MTKKLTALKLYEAALENAIYYEIPITKQYIEDYASNALNTYIDSETAQLIIDKHEAYEKQEEHSQCEYLYAIQEPLSEIELYL